ncbi:1-phosphofructokinase family hexose kinase [Candidatus Chloroploca sp. M-50]|uniref:1-phosphofructokinase family hexose kinase n=1 Tax=Candidatus Chloroploca mongolica TaxID=2528176 RepID=A0ABS4DGG2_9CHLR|nr:1-phosphofructokinase family hexose kinase [Candidatus Chloroploca mongolica]MBP1468531.1 1-phosphofructokinase family hexose kinase [Candidatus Chloroploca mongolica]
MIVTLTMNPSVDVSTDVDHVMPEHKLRCSAARFEPGGGGLNVSRALRNLGEESLALYTAGGMHGAMLQDLLDHEHVPHRALAVAGPTRESFAVLETNSGQQFRFNLPGPTLSEPEWRACLEALASITPVPTFIVASGSLPPGVPDHFYAEVAAFGRTIGARVSVDTSGAALQAAVDASLFLIKPNLRELALLVGRPLDDEAEVERAALELVSSGRTTVVVVSLGAAGALLATGTTCERLRSPTVPIRSKVGAGDSMVAGIVAGLVRGLDLREAVRFGVAAGAAAVMTPGSELCRRDDTERLYRYVRREVE